MLISALRAWVSHPIRLSWAGGGRYLGELVAVSESDGQIAFAPQQSGETYPVLLNWTHVVKVERLESEV